MDKKRKAPSLQDIYDEAINLKHWSFFDWYPNYAKSVKEFQKSALAGICSDEVFSKYSKTPDNGISSLVLGGFTNIEYDKIKEHWSEITTLLQEVVEKGNMIDEEYDRFKT